MASRFGNNKPLMLLLVAILSMAHHISYALVEATETDLSTRSYGEEATMTARHEKWMAEHGRTYKDDVEKAQRFEVFKDNAGLIDRANAAGDKKYILAANKFADMTGDEFVARYTGFKPVPSSGPQKLSSSKYDNLTLSQAQQGVDWRKKGAVTGVKNQASCSCAWAFSAVAAMEGINQITTGKLVPLSEQQLVDCDIDNNGCRGGAMDRAFQYVIGNGGLPTEDAYPYTASQGKCQSVQPVVKIRGYQDVPSGDEEALAAAVAKQPVSAAVDADSFQFYSGGILSNDSCGRNPNHAVTVVGFGITEDGSYWLLKNSWGQSWGEGGYIRLERGTNTCGVANNASYPVTDGNRPPMPTPTPFVVPPASPPAPMVVPVEKHKRRMSKVFIVSLVVPLFALFICGIISFKFIPGQIKGSQDVKEDEVQVWGPEGTSSGFIIYDLLQVLEATGNFSEENKLGQGGFGPVYKMKQEVLY